MCVPSEAHAQQWVNGKLKVAENKHFHVYENGNDWILVMDDFSLKYPEQGKVYNSN